MQLELIITVPLDSSYELVRGISFHSEDSRLVGSYPGTSPNIIGKMVEKPLGMGALYSNPPKNTVFFSGIYWVFYPLGGEIHQVLVDFAGQGIKGT